MDKNKLLGNTFIVQGMFSFFHTSLQVIEVHSEHLIWAPQNQYATLDQDY
mgnify:CR=1 FL=1